MSFSRLFSAALLFVTLTANAQWIQVGPPGYFSSIVRSTNGLFAALQGAGIYVSRDEGATWASANTGLTTFEVTGLSAIGNAVYASTAGGGVLSTNDQTINWAPMNSYLISLNVGSITAIGGILYAGPVNYGAFLSTDRGWSWAPAGRGLATGSVRTYARQDSMLLAGTATDGVYRSTDGGQTWVAANVGLPSQSDVVAFAVLGRLIFAAAAFEGIYCSSDGGLTWTPRNAGLTNKGVTCLVAVPFPGGGVRLLTGTAAGGAYASADSGSVWSRLDMGNSSNLVGTLVARGSTVYAGVAEGVRVSTDAGMHWGPVGTGLSNSSVSGVCLAGGKIYAGTTRSGVYVSADGGAIWSQANKNLLNTEITCMTTDGTAVYVGTTGGTVSIRRLADSTWTNTGGDITGHFINALGVFGTTLLAAPAGIGIYYSKNMGYVWRQGAGSLRLPQGTTATSFAAAGSFFFAGTDGQGVLRSPDSAKTWSWKNDSLADLAVHALLVVDSLLVAGTSDGIYVYPYRNLETGAWRRGSPDLNGHSVSAFMQSGSALLAGTDDGRVYISLTGGRQWRSVSQGLPPGSVRSLATDGVEVCAGTSLGGVCRRSLVEMIALAAVAERPALLPADIRLEQNYPNPFNPSTTLTFGLGAAARVRLAVYDLLGRTVEVLIDGEKPAGTHVIRWDAVAVPSGVYFCRLEARAPGGAARYAAQTRKMVLIH